jgi:hypothetical protein
VGTLTPVMLALFLVIVIGGSATAGYLTHGLIHHR